MSEFQAAIGRLPDRLMPGVIFATGENARHTFT